MTIRHTLMFIVAVHVQAVFAAEDLFELSLEELMQVPVTGSTLVERSWQQTPSAVTVFSRDQIQRLGVNYIEELMNLVPGFQRYRASQNQFNYVYSSRGRRIAEGAYDVLLLIDGMTIHSPRARSNAASHGFIPVDNVERVEFIRGPGSALYGSNAMMGVINIITTRGNQNFSVEAGSFNHRSVSFSTAIPLGDFNWDTSLYYSKDHGDDYWLRDPFTPIGAADSDPLEVTKFASNLYWEDGQIRLRYSRNVAGGFYVFSNLASDVNYFDLRLWQGAWSQSWTNDYFSSELVLSHNQDSIYGRAQLLPEGALFALSVPQSMAALTGEFSLDSREQAARWSQQWKINTGKLVTGIELHRITTTAAESRNHFDLAALVNRQFPIRYLADALIVTPVEDTHPQDNTALYGQYIVHIGERFELTAGARIDHYKNVDSNFSPRLGLVYQFDEQQRVKLLYGEAFRAPSNAERGLINNPVSLGNPDLKPELVNTLEFIWLAQWRSFNWHVGYFDNHFTDAIIQVSAGQGQLLRYENIDQGSSSGFEMEMSHQLNENVLWRFSAMHLLRLPEEGWREARSMYSMTFNAQLKRWNVNMTAVHHGAREMIVSNNTARRLILDTYWQLDCKILYALTDRVHAFLQGNNVLDNDYLSPPQVSTLPEPIPDRGRHWSLGVTWSL